MIKINKYSIFIAFIIFFNLQGLYLLDDSIFHTSDIAVILEMVFIFYVALKGGYKGKSQFGIIMIIPIILMFTSSYAAYVHYGQPIWYGIRAQRAWIFAMLMYFPLSGLLRNRKISINSIVKILDFLVFAYAILLIVQFFVASKYVFLHLTISSRYGSARLYASTYFVLLIYFIHLKNLIDKKRVQLFDILVILSTVFIHLFVTKSRMGLAALVLATAFAVFSSKFTGRKLFLVVVGLVLIAVFITLPYGQTVLDAMFGSTARDAGTAIRDVGRVFYIKQTLSTRLYAVFGSGYANLDWVPTAIGIRYSEGIYYNDQGIIGLFFYYGFAMVIWTVVTHIKVMRDSWKSNTREIFMFLLCGLIGAYTLFPYNYVTDISFAIALAMVDRSILENCK